MNITKTKDGETFHYDVNADNPQHTWRIRETFTMYGGRCKSHQEFDLAIGTFPSVSRDAAELAALHWIENNRETGDLEHGQDPHAKPGEFCPTCDTVHCTDDTGHVWDGNDYCGKCGADGRS